MRRGEVLTCCGSAGGDQCGHKNDGCSAYHHAVSGPRGATVSHEVARKRIEPPTPAIASGLWGGMGILNRIRARTSTSPPSLVQEKGRLINSAQHAFLHQCVDGSSLARDYCGAMKALTMTQPWATLVALGENTIETRSWSTSYRGPLAIHSARAAQRLVPEHEADFGDLSPGRFGFVLRHVRRLSRPIPA